MLFIPITVKVNWHYRELEPKINGMTTLLYTVYKII